MRCPSCNEIIDLSLQACKSCGHLFPSEILLKLILLKDFKQDIQKLIQLKDNLCAGVENFSRKINHEEGALQNELNLSVQKEPEPIISTISKQAPLEPVPQPDKPNTYLNPALNPTRASIANEATNVEVKLRQQWLLILDIATMVFGIGYFLKYSFEQGWVGPAGREAMTYLWGLILLPAGDRFRKKEIDISSFSTPYRIISFIILGVVLVVTSYLLYRFNEKIMSIEPAKERLRKNR